jgi:hypothetical protein
MAAILITELNVIKKKTNFYQLLPTMLLPTMFHIVVKAKAVTCQGSF